MTTHVQPNLPNWITRLNGYHFFLNPFIHSVEYKPQISGYSQSGPSAIHLSGTDCISILMAFSRRSQIDPFFFCFNSPHVLKKEPLRISALEQVFVILYEPHKLLKSSNHINQRLLSTQNDKYQRHGRWPHCIGSIVS